MGFCQIRTAKVDVDIEGLDTLMAHDPLQSEQIAAIPEIVSGKSVAEGVRGQMNTGDSSRIPEAADDNLKRILIEWLTSTG